MRKHIRRLLLLTAAAFMLATPGVALAVDFAPKGNFKIKLRIDPSKCLHIKYGNFNNGNPIHLWDCGGTNTTNDTWIYDSELHYIRLAASPHKCIHKVYGGYFNGNGIHLWDCDAGAAENKTWRFGRGWHSPDNFVVDKISTWEDHVETRPDAIIHTPYHIHRQHPNVENGNPAHIWEGGCYAPPGERYHANCSWLVEP